MLVDMLHAFAHEETRELIDWDGIFGAGCFYGEKVLVALYEGLITFDEAGHVVNPGAIDAVGEQMAVATRIYTHQVRDVVTYAQTTDGAQLGVRLMGMTGFGNRQTSSWFVFTPSEDWAADGALKSAGNGRITEIVGAQKTPEYVLGLTVDTYYSKGGAIVDLADGVKEEPRHLKSVLGITSTIFNSKHDFVQRIQNGDYTKLSEHPRLMTPREVAAAERMGITPSRDNEWPDWLLRTLRRERRDFMRSGGYERLKMWPYWLIWIDIDCLSLWSGIVYEMVALDPEGRVVLHARPAPYVDETTNKHFLAWDDAPQTRSDFDSVVDLDDKANWPTTFLSADELREALDIEKSNAEKHTEGIGGVCNEHIRGSPCNRGDACEYAYHYGHENLGTFYKASDKCHKHTDELLYCKVCGAPWDKEKQRCSDAKTCPGGTWDKYHAIREACDLDDTKSYPAWWGKDYVPEGGVKIAPPKVDAVRALTERERRALTAIDKGNRVKIITEGHAHQDRVGKVTSKKVGVFKVRLDPVAGETMPVSVKVRKCELVRVDDAAGASAVEGREGAGEEKTEEAGDDPEPMEL